MKYLINDVVVDATQWFINGDHPGDKRVVFSNEAMHEGLVVKYFRDPSVEMLDVCNICGCISHLHGYIEGHGSVCPSDWVLTSSTGKHTACSDAIFKKIALPCPVSSIQLI
jgi:hypothetical protein